MHVAVSCSRIERRRGAANINSRNTFWGPEEKKRIGRKAFVRRLLPYMIFIALAVVVYHWIPERYSLFLILVFVILAVIFAGIGSAYEIQLQIQNHELDRAVKTRMLEKLLEGFVPPEDNLTKTLAETRNGIHSEYFSIVQLGFIDVSGLFPDNDGVLEEEYEEIDFLIRQVFSREIDKKHISYYIPQNMGMCIVVNLFGIDENDPDVSGRQITQELCRMVERCLVQLRDNQSVIIGAVVSTVFYGQAQISEAYQEALELTSYAELMGDSKMVKNAYDLEEIPVEVSAKALKMELEKQYVSCVSVRDFSGAADMLDQIIVSEMPAALHSAPQIKNRLVMRLEQLLSIMCISVTDYDASEFQVVSELKKLLELNTVDDLRKQAYAVIMALDAYSKTAIETNSSRVEAILDFVKENYANPAISATMISDHFGISAPYLSRILKQNTGLGIVDCIHKARLEKAKELFKNPALSMDEIAEQVGFSNRWTLSRSFKRYEGVTPGVYRDMQKK